MRLRTKRLWLVGSVGAAGFIVSLIFLALLWTFSSVDHSTTSLGVVLLTAVILLFVSCVAVLVQVMGARTEKNKFDRLEARIQQRVSQDHDLSHQILYQSIHASLKPRDFTSQLGISTKVVRKPVPTNKMLFVTSNGGGLGHVSRMLAIAAELDGDVRFFTLSRGYSLIAEAGYQGVHIPSHEYSGVSRELWGRIFTAAFVKELATYRPDIILFDGTAIYPELRGATKIFGIPFVWLRRGLWKENIRIKSQQYNFPQTVCDYLIEPADLAFRSIENPEKHMESSPWKFSVSAIVNQKPDLMLTREAALEELDLNARNRHVLIQLGAGNINEIGHTEKVAAEAVRELGSDWVPVIARSPISQLTKGSPWPVISRFPVSSYFNAFEFCIISGGYNSVQEALSLKLPSISVPNLLTYTDDQAARTSSAAERGLMIEACDNDDIFRAIVLLGDEENRQRIRNNLMKIQNPRGSYEAANILDYVAKQAKQAHPLSF